MGAEVHALAHRYRLAADAWLGGVLGRRAWTVAPEGEAPLAELRAPGAQLATAKVDAADTASLLALQGLGFGVVDAALTFDADEVPAEAGGAAVRFARPQDRAAVEALAGSAFRFSRFHLDPRIPRTLADKVKAAWAANFFAGQRGDGMVVAEEAGEVAGFLQLLWSADGRLVIDLIAVRPQSARRGLARAMIGFAGARGTGNARKVSGLRVGTQAANAPSVRLYESLGFRLRQAKFVLHHHGAGA